MMNQTKNCPLSLTGLSIRLRSGRLQVRILQGVLLRAIGVKSVWPEIAFGKLSAKLSCGQVVGNCRIFRGVEVSQTQGLFVEANNRSPAIRCFVTMDAAVAACTPRPAKVPPVLISVANPQVFSLVVQAVPVFVIHQHSRGRLHDDYVNQQRLPSDAIDHRSVGYRVCRVFFRLTPPRIPPHQLPILRIDHGHQIGIRQGNVHYPDNRRFSSPSNSSRGPPGSKYALLV